MKFLLPLAWSLFVLKTTCECSSRSDDTPLKKNSFRNKAISDGAISFYMDHFVRTRVSKVTYGNFCSIPYDPSDPDHRSHTVFTAYSGEKRVGVFFDIILPKVSGLISFPKRMFFLKKIFVEYPSFGDEGIQNVLLPEVRFFSWFTSCY